VSSTRSTCAACGAPLLPRSRFCPTCGVSTTAPPSSDAHELLIPGNKQLRISADQLSISELLAVVKAGVAVWEEQLKSPSAVTREAAAKAVRDLGLVFESLSQQLALGRSTVRITRRLPTQRASQVGCPVCGRGNRAGARFCQFCGASLVAAAGPPPLRVRTASSTDVGRARANNEDSVFIGPIKVGGAPATLCLVADGMGGAEAGEVASEIAAEQVPQLVAAATEAPADDEAWQALLRRAVVEANRQIYALARSGGGRRGMGTTLTVAAIAGDRVHIAHVGDSRAYLLNPAGAAAEGTPWLQLTTDHSLVARLVDIGQLTPEQARVHPQRNMLYRSVGTDPQTEVETASFRIQGGDTLLLCSDGLSGYIEDAELARMVAAAPDLETACARLVALANERGGRDNISVVLASLAAADGRPPTTDR
jgi:serine/threonine protein phosphatase PrpC